MTRKLHWLLVVLVLTLGLLACAGTGGTSSGDLSKEDVKQQVIEDFGDAVDPASIVVNGIVACTLSDQAKVAYNVDAAWLVNVTRAFVTEPFNTGPEEVAYSLGRKDGKLKVLLAGSCP